MPSKVIDGATDVGATVVPFVARSSGCCRGHITKATAARNSDTIMAAVNHLDREPPMSLTSLGMNTESSVVDVGGPSDGGIKVCVDGALYKVAGGPPAIASSMAS